MEDGGIAKKMCYMRRGSHNPRKHGSRRGFPEQEEIVLHLEDKKGISMRSRMVNRGENRGAGMPVLRLRLGVGRKDNISALVDHTRMDYASQQIYSGFLSCGRLLAWSCLWSVP